MTLSIEEREHLRATARSLLASVSSPDRVRTIIESGPGFDRDLWRQMVELGWTTIHLPEHLGGGGCGYADLGVVLHELGRAITPSPLLASAVLASTALAAVSDHPQAAEALGSLATGESVGTVAMVGPSGSYETAQLGVTWGSTGESVVLDGSAAFVLDADIADVLVVAALDASGAVAVFLVDGDTPGISVTFTPAVDRTRRLFTLSFDGVSVPADRMLCDPGAASESLLGQVLRAGVIAAACDSVGVAEVALERTAEYATNRKQFGKPIGSFQAVKHHCSNMAIAVTASGSAVGAALRTLDDDPAGALQAAAITSSFVGPACSEACGLALLVHGGIGFTWEHDSHLYLKRTKLNEMLFGTPSWHRQRLADAVFPTLATNG